MFRRQWYRCNRCHAVGSVVYRAGARPAVVAALIIADHRALEPDCDDGHLLCTADRREPQYDGDARAA